MTHTEGGDRRRNITIIDGTERDMIESRDRLGKQTERNKVQHNKM